MLLSKETTAALVDLIENKLAIMCISDCDDLREKITMQRALVELRGMSATEAGILKNYNEIPRRGRRRKISSILEEQESHHHDERR